MTLPLVFRRKFHIIPVLVFQEPVEVTVPGKIISYTSSLEMTGKRSVKAVQDEGSEEILLSAPVYVIYK